MATFRVGQRVKRVAHAIAGIPIGSTGIVTCDPNRAGDVGVKWDAGTGGDTNCIGYIRDTLAPLTDPRASDFVADMERFAKLAKVPA